MSDNRSPLVASQSWWTRIVDGMRQMAEAMDAHPLEMHEARLSHLERRIEALESNREVSKLGVSTPQTEETK